MISTLRSAHLHRLDADRHAVGGLTAIAQDELQQDTSSDHLFVFVSRCDRVKITRDEGGFVLVYERLERGQLKLPHMDPSTISNRPANPGWQAQLEGVILRVPFAEEPMADQDRERWTKLVADFEASDLTQRAFASERGISFSNLRNWIYRLRKESRPPIEAAPTSSGQGPARAPTMRRSRLVPVRVVA